MADNNARPTLHVEFFTRAVQNPRASKEKGRPIFEDKEFVRIRFPGDRNRTHEAFATEKALRDPQSNEWLSYIDRFPRHYEAFKKGQAYIGEGTPLAELVFLTESQRAELRALNIHTAESLAAMEGVPLKQLGMGGRELKNQAQAYLDSATGSAAMTKLAADNASLQDQLSMLREQVAQLTQPAKPAPRSGSPFEPWDDADIKNWLAEKTGARPKGNPSHATLVAMADEVSAQVADQVAA